MYNIGDRVAVSYYNKYHAILTYKIGTINRITPKGNKIVVELDDGGYQEFTGKLDIRKLAIITDEIMEKKEIADKKIIERESLSNIRHKLYDLAESQAIMRVNNVQEVLETANKLIKLIQGENQNG